MKCDFNGLEQSVGAFHILYHFSFVVQTEEFLIKLMALRSFFNVKENEIHHFLDDAEARP